RGQHRVQPGPVRQGRVDVRARVVQTPSGEGGESLGQATDRRLVGEADVGSNQTAAPVHPDAVGSVDQYVRHSSLVEEVLERAGAGELGLCLPDQPENLSMAGQAAGVLADQRGERRAPRRRTGVDQLSAYPIEDLSVHAASPIATGTRRIVSQSAASSVFRSIAVGSPICVAARTVTSSGSSPASGRPKPCATSSLGRAPGTARTTTRGVGPGGARDSKT